MIKYNIEPIAEIEGKRGKISSFLDIDNSENLDKKTVESFGDEWSKFDSFDADEISLIGDEYFDIVDDTMLNKNMTALDVGCGTGRWTKYVASRAGFVEAVDPSKAVFAAEHLLSDLDNIRISQAGVSKMPFPKDSFDFVFSLGVLHHIPDTKQAMVDSVKMLKPGGYFLVYLYYSLDNRGGLFKLIFHLSNAIRQVVYRLPQGLKAFVCDILAVLFYMPLVTLSRIFNRIPGLKKLVKYIPLSSYANKTFNVIRNDSLDRFGTPLEQRFSRKEITEMMEFSGLTDVKFSEKEPFWHAVGRKK